MRTSLVVAGIVIGSWTAVPAAAQNCGFYCNGAGEEGCCTTEGYHTLDGYGWYTNKHIGCVQNGTDTHNLCSFASADAPTRESCARMLAAASKGDVNTVLKLATRAPDFVIVNQERSSIQLVSCDRTTFIANLIVPENNKTLGRMASLAALKAERLRMAHLLAGTPLSTGL